jgi:urease accessory protein
VRHRGCNGGDRTQRSARGAIFVDSQRQRNAAAEQLSADANRRFDLMVGMVIMGQSRPEFPVSDIIRATKVLDPHSFAEAAVADRVVLDYDDRHRRRMTMEGVEGLSFLLDLAEAVPLVSDAGLELEDGRIVLVVAAAEPLVEIRTSDAGHMVRVAWHLGNRHLPTQIMGTKLRIRRDHVIEDMVRGLGAKVVPIEAPFDPEGGAYGHGTVTGHDHGHGHHGHSHSHGQAHDHHAHDHSGHDHHHGHSHEDHDHEHGREPAPTRRDILSFKGSGEDHSHDEAYGCGHDHAHDHDGHGHSHDHAHSHAPGHRHGHKHG